MSFSDALAAGPASLFEQVNAFVGGHQDCSDAGEDLAYSITCQESAHGCAVSVACRCGAAASFVSTREDADALTAIAQRFDIPTQHG